MRIKAFFLISFLSFAAVAAAQTGDEYSLFMNAAGSQSILFRGHQPVQYVNIRYNGHYWWDAPEFKKGTVMLDGKRYADVYLNVDACSKNLLSCMSPGAQPIALNRDDVEWFDIGGVHFVNLQRQGLYRKTAPGFYVVLKEGPVQVFFRVDKSLVSGTDDYNGKDGIGYDDPNYRREILSAFICHRNYYTVKNGEMKRISEKKARALIDE